MRRTPLVALVTCLVTLLLVSTSSAQRKPAGKKKPAEKAPAAAAKPAETMPDEKIDGLFVLGGQAGLPKYLKCNQGVLADEKGVRGGEVRTVDTDFFQKDFKLDVVFEFPPTDDERFGGIVGIGENGRDGGWITNSIVADLSSPAGAHHKGVAQIRKHRSPDRQEIGKYGDHRGPHLLRMQKTGKALTFALSGQFDGTQFKADFVKTIPDLAAAAPYLNRLNSALFFGENCTFTAVRLEVDGKLVDPGPRADQATTAGSAIDLSGTAGLHRIAAGSALPGYLAPNTKAAVGTDGMSMKDVVLMTRNGDFLTKDFTFDVVYSFDPAKDGPALLLGLGENGRDSGNWVLNSVAATAAHPMDRWGPGHMRFTWKSFADMRTWGKTGKDHFGPNLLRMQKRGDTLMYAVCVGFKDKFVPDFIMTVPSLKAQAPYVTERNSHLFFGQGATVQAVRLVVDGKLVDPGAAAPPAVASNTGPGVPPAGGNTPPAAVRPQQPGTPAPAGRPAATNQPPAATPQPAAPAAAAVGEMYSLAGAAGLPAYLKCNQETLGNGEGLVGGEVRTIDADFASKDFTLDLLVDFPPNTERQQVAFVGIGENGREGGWVLNSVRLELRHPANEGLVQLIRHRSPDRPKLGTIVGGAGPQIVRMQKSGSAITFSYGSAATGGAFRPAGSLSLPDLAGAAQFKPGNAGLFFGGHGVFKAVRLEVAGKAVDPGRRPAPPVADVTGPQGLVKITDGRSLPTFFVAQPKLAGGAGGMPLTDVTLRTRAGDFMTKDFTLDVVYRMPSDTHKSLLLGIGENKRDGGNWAINSLMVRMHGAGNEWARGAGMLTFKSFAQMQTWAPLGADRGGGPNLLRMQKRGDTLTFAIMANYKDKFTPDYVVVVPSLKQQAPYLTDKNGYLFLGEAGTLEQVRLIVGAETVDGIDIALAMPERAVEDQPVRAQVVKAAGARKLSLEEAPKGMTLSPTGQFAWTPSVDQVGRHDFKVRITDGTSSYAKSVTVEVYPKADAAAVRGDLAKVESLYKMPAGEDRPKLVPGQGQSLLMLEGSKLRRLDADGFTVRQSYDLPKSYQWVGERAAYFVMMSNEGKCVDLVDKQTLKVRQSIQMDYHTRSDLALHPTHAVSYVAVRRVVGERLTDTVLIVNEATGDVLEPENFLGTFLRSSPDGRLLYAGYKDIYHKGDRLLINPDNIFVVPEYGTIDVLIVYDVSAPARPRVLASKMDAGANGQGLALSPDGKRVSYLSFVGYPKYSNNIAAWDAFDLGKRPVAYATKDNKADCKRLAFHPTLPIAAAPAEGGGVAFDRETGQLQPNRLDLRLADLSAATTHDLIFSPDGRNLILVCEEHGEWYLRRVPVTLTPAEADKAKAAPPAAAPPPGPAPAKPPGQPQRV